MYLDEKSNDKLHSICCEPTEIGISNFDENVTCTLTDNSIELY